MDGEPKNDIGESATKKKKGVLCRLWNAVFRPQPHDFARSLFDVLDEEMDICSRIFQRAQRRRQIDFILTVCFILLELIAVGYAMTTARSANLTWEMRAWRVMPMFLLPALTFFNYNLNKSFSNMCDRKDFSTLEKLRVEREAKIIEQQGKTNHFASLTMYQILSPDTTTLREAIDTHVRNSVSDEPNGESNDVEIAKTGAGLGKRNSSHSEISSMEDSSYPYQPGELIPDSDGAKTPQQHPLVLEHQSDELIPDSDGAETFQQHPSVLKHKPNELIPDSDGAETSQQHPLVLEHKPNELIPDSDSAETSQLHSLFVEHQSDELIPDSDGAETFQHHPLFVERHHQAVGAAVAVVGLAAYHVFAARNNVSSKHRTRI